MMYSVRSATDCDADRWDSFVFTGKFGITPYHRYQWRRIISQSYSLDSEYLFVENEVNDIVGILPLFFINLGHKRVGISLPYCTHAGMAGADLATQQLLFNAILNICVTKKINYVELREMDPASIGSNRNLVTQILTLEDSIGVQWSKLESKCKGAVKRAQKYGLQIIEGGLGLITTFYRIYQKNMGRLGTPAHPERLFSKVIEELKNDASVLIIKNAGEAIGGMLVIKSGEIAHDPWVASLERFNNFYPNDFLYWESICWAIRRGCKKFDFGRSRRGSGVYGFKKKWGTTDINLNYKKIMPSGEIKTNSNSLIFLDKLFSFIWSRLPERLISEIGPNLRKYIP